MFAVKLTDLYSYFGKIRLRWCSFLTHCIVANLNSFSNSGSSRVVATATTSCYFPAPILLPLNNTVHHQTSQDSIHALTEDNVQLRSTLRSLLAENRANATLLIQPYKKGQNIETWLRQFEVAASSVGLNGVSHGIQVLKYLPGEASAWLMRTVDLTHWPTIVEKLASVYGVDPHVQKTICRRKLESLKQAVLHGIVAPEDTWKILAVAVATRESALFLGNDHLLFEAPQSVVEPPFPMIAPAPEPAGPTPTELDAFTRRSSNKGDQRQHRPVSQRPSSDQMHRWARPGVPICGHCGTEGHLTKRCFKKQNRQTVHALQEQSPQDANLNYPSNEPFSDDTICSLTYMTKPSVAYHYGAKNLRITLIAGAD
ncbi:hypothetical protein G6F37_012309 [Rhizopus arrhizus]|nr:hypothetical protein G6F38_012286 [Rhizopus arrhizus]KAG1144388.1 hypothetical protein G6F37_012309 [Rhizopus arrhizus]